MPPIGFPSISSLLNSPTRSCQQWPSSAEMYPEPDQPLSSPNKSIITISSDDEAAIPRPSTRLSYTSRSETMSPLPPFSTLLRSDSLPPLQGTLLPPIDIGVNDPFQKHRQPPNASFDGGRHATFSIHGGSTTPSEPPPQTPSTTLSPPHTALLTSLLNICTTSALQFYHSLLPPPTLCITIHQNHLHSPPPPPQPTYLQISTTTAYYPCPTPQTVHLCHEALLVARAADASLSLTQLLDLISHATRTEDSGWNSRPQQWEAQSGKAAWMAGLWDLADRLLRMMSRAGEGGWLEAGGVDEGWRIAGEFCGMLGDERAVREVDAVWEGLQLGR